MSNLRRLDVPGGSPVGGPPPNLADLVRVLTPHVNALYALLPPGVRLEVRQKASAIEVPGQPPLPPLTISRGAITVDIEMARIGEAPPPLLDEPAT
ncbi:MAG TPA: hypothetical protein PLE19_12610 [Planctomycetota bacterium]|nr:hypothetical protein [Planctomycetota bacterium]HRR83149.1 hypothetical protein [Planctomycetota bacterium]